MVQVLGVGGWGGRKEQGDAQDQTFRYNKIAEVLCPLETRLKKIR